MGCTSAPMVDAYIPSTTPGAPAPLFDGQYRRPRSTSKKIDYKVLLIAC